MAAPIKYIRENVVIIDIFLVRYSYMLFDEPSVSNPLSLYSRFASISITIFPLVKPCEPASPLPVVSPRSDGESLYHPICPQAQ